MQTVMPYRPDCSILAEPGPLCRRLSHVHGGWGLATQVAGHRLGEWLPVWPLPFTAQTDPQYSVTQYNDHFKT